MSDAVESILAGYVDLDPFAKEVKRHPRTVRRWMDELDGLPYTKLGNRILIRRASARQWLAAKEHKPNPRRKPESRRRRQQSTAELTTS